jgi:hypothetical protein
MDAIRSAIIDEGVDRDSASVIIDYLTPLPLLPFLEELSTHTNTIRRRTFSRWFYRPYIVCSCGDCGYDQAYLTMTIQWNKGDGWHIDTVNDWTPENGWDDPKANDGHFYAMDRRHSGIAAYKRFKNSDDSIVDVV